MPNAGIGWVEFSVTAQIAAAARRGEDALCFVIGIGEGTSCL
jgi:hypothetical protein